MKINKEQREHILQRFAAAHEAAIERAIEADRELKKLRAEREKLFTQRRAISAKLDKLNATIDHGSLRVAAGLGVQMPKHHGYASCDLKHYVPEAAPYQALEDKLLLSDGDAQQALADALASIPKF